MGGVISAREQDSSIGRGAGNDCLGVVHMEEEAQDRVQVEVGREEQSEGETHGDLCPVTFLSENTRLKHSVNMSIPT